MKDDPVYDNIMDLPEFQIIQPEIKANLTEIELLQSFDLRGI